MSNERHTIERLALEHGGDAEVWREPVFAPRFQGEVPLRARFADGCEFRIDSEGRAAIVNIAIPMTGGSA